MSNATRASAGDQRETATPSRRRVTASRGDETNIVGLFRIAAVRRLHGSDAIAPTESGTRLTSHSSRGCPSAGADIPQMRAAAAATVSAIAYLLRTCALQHAIAFKRARSTVREQCCNPRARRTERLSRRAVHAHRTRHRGTHGDQEFADLAKRDWQTRTCGVDGALPFGPDISGDLRHFGWAHSARSARPRTSHENVTPAQPPQTAASRSCGTQSALRQS